MLGHDAFEIFLASECEQLLAVALDVVAVQDAQAFLAQDGAESLLAFDQRGVRQVLAVAVQQVKGDEARLATIPKAMSMIMVTCLPRRRRRRQCPYRFL